jgi:Uma2 family endonuclease
VALSLDVVHRLPLGRYHDMVDAGFLEGQRVELIEGVLVVMSPRGPEHEDAIAWLTARFVPALVERFSVRVQSALTLEGSGSEPEPDLLVAALDAPKPRHYAAALLVVEVAASPLEYDRRTKSAVYAPAVAEYWVVDLEHEAVEVRTRPAGDHYEELHTARAGEVLVPALLGAPEVDVAELFAAAKR